MTRESSDRENQWSEFLLIRPAAAFVALGMILPEYMLLLAVSAFLTTMVLAMVETINDRDEPQHAEAPPVIS